MPSHPSLRESFGDIDIYLFDQLLKGRFAPGMRVLDAGCGDGRNIIYLLGNGFEVHGVDLSHDAIARARSLAARLAPDLPSGNFRVEAVEHMSFADASFDAVISSAVLHFARDEKQWWSMLEEMWRVLAPGGILFARLASSIGIENLVTHLEGRRYHLPDGSNRFLVDEEMLVAATATLGARLLDPLKTVVVQGMRSMSTWCIAKP
jgi:SAM-dependent methyltransferase